MKVLTGAPFSGKITIRKNTLAGENGVQVFNMQVWKEIKISDNDFKHLSGAAFMNSEGFTPDFHIDKNLMPDKH